LCLIGHTFWVCGIFFLNSGAAFVSSLQRKERGAIGPYFFYVRFYLSGKMNSEQLIDSFAEFAKQRNIDRPTVIRILEDVFRAMIRKKYGVDSNFDVIINLDKGDLQIWRFREIVDDNSEDIWDEDKISLSEAVMIEPDFEVGEEVAEEIKLVEFGRREIITAKQALLQRIKDLEKDSLYQKYTRLMGEIVNVEVYQVLSREVILLDDERNELILPKSEQIPKDRFRKGEFI